MIDAMNWNEILALPAAEVRRPPITPIGDWPGMVKGYELKSTTGEKAAKVIEVTVQLTGYPDALPEEWIDFDEGKQITVRKADIDLSFRSMTFSFYASELHKLTAALKSMGISLLGEGERKKELSECLEEMKGRLVIVGIKHAIAKKSGQTYAAIDKLKGIEGPR